MAVPDTWWPLKRIYENNREYFEKHNISFRQFEAYGTMPRAKRIGFPEVKRQLSRYKFFDENEVMDWVELWTRINRGGHPEHMRSGREKSNAERAKGGE